MVDDDEELVELVTEYLRREGFDTEAVHDGEAGLTRALSGEHSLIVLDVMLPGIGGFEVLRRIRASASPAARVPILMLTARGEEIDRVMGLEWGADDYLAKPHSPQELLARVRAMLRRVRLDREAHQPVPEPEPAHSASTPQSQRLATQHLHVGDVELDGAARMARIGGEPLDLTAVEFELLALLLSHAGEVVTREAVSREVFDRPLTHFDRALDVHISNLRRKLGTPADSSERIKTVRGIGYVFARV
ncbi:transcriptional regulatory protein CpxR [Abditibacteriota bacterium]|nr:transcriptional regulatory protein CpxR [Abditibacteriota bacterium]